MSVHTCVRIAYVNGVVRAHVSCYCFIPYLFVSGCLNLYGYLVRTHITRTCILLKLFCMSFPPKAIKGLAGEFSIRTKPCLGTEPIVLATEDVLVCSWRRTGDITSTGYIGGKCDKPTGNGSGTTGWATLVRSLHGQLTDNTTIRIAARSVPRTYVSYVRIKFNRTYTFS